MENKYAGPLKLLIVLGLVLITNGGCTKETGAKQEVIPTPVYVVEAKRQTLSKELYYTGVVQPEEMQKLSFKTAGLADEIHVDIGDIIQEGEKLITMDVSDFQLGLKAARANYDGATALYDKAIKGALKEDIEQLKLNVVKAREAYELAEKTYMQVQVLKEKGAVSGFDEDQAKTQRDVAKATYDQALTALQQGQNGARKEDLNAAKSQQNAAKVDVDRYEKMIKEATLYAPFEGKVMEILYENNEMIPAGYPAILVRNHQQIVNIGVAGKTKRYLVEGMEVRIIIEGESLKGRITSISDIPNETTRLYDIQITREKGDLPIGSVVEVKIPVETKEGIWIPIQYIKIDDSEYVYIAKGGKAEKKRLKMIASIKDQVLVEGIEEGDQIIIKGHRYLESGDPIKPVMQKVQEETKTEQVQVIKEKREQVPEGGVVP